MFILPDARVRHMTEQRGEKGGVCWEDIAQNWRLLQSHACTEKPGKMYNVRWQAHQMKISFSSSRARHGACPKSLFPMGSHSSQHRTRESPHGLHK